MQIIKATAVDDIPFAINLYDLLALFIPFYIPGQQGKVMVNERVCLTG